MCYDVILGNILICKSFPTAFAIPAVKSSAIENTLCLTKLQRPSGALTDPMSSMNRVCFQRVD